MKKRLIVFGIVVSACGETTIPDPPPETDRMPFVSLSAAYSIANQSVLVDALGSDPDGDTVTLTVNILGSTFTSSGINPSVSRSVLFPQIRNLDQDVQLTASASANGKSDSLTRTLTVPEVVDIPPTILGVSIIPAIIVQGEGVSFGVDMSDDIRLARYDYDLQNGRSGFTDFTNSETKTAGITVATRYTEAGVFNPSFTVTDDFGQTADTTIQITVNPTP